MAKQSRKQKRRSHKEDIVLDEKNDTVCAVAVEEEDTVVIAGGGSSSSKHSSFSPRLSSPSLLPPARKKRKRRHETAAADAAASAMATKQGIYSGNSSSRHDTENDNDNDYTNGEAYKIALRQAQARFIPVGITSLDDLVWYTHGPSSDNDHARLYPCRIIPADEARWHQSNGRRLDPTTSWNHPKECALVQALVDGTPFDDGRQDTILVNRTSLQPYHGNNGSTTRNNNTDKHPADRPKWCPTLWKTYRHQRLQQQQRPATRGSTFLTSQPTTEQQVELLTMWLYLNRMVNERVGIPQDCNDRNDTGVSDENDDGSSHKEREEERDQGCRQQQQPQQQHRKRALSVLSSSSSSSSDSSPSDKDDDDDDDEKKMSKKSNKKHNHKTTHQQQQQHFDYDDISIASDEMEVPYAEHYLVGNANDHDNVDKTKVDYFEDKHLFDDDRISTEPLRPGDVIQYTHPSFTEGHRHGKRVTTVLSTDPSKEYMLMLQNGELLPKDTLVTRIHVMEHGKLYKHPNGYVRAISQFAIRKCGSATLLDGLKHVGENVNKVVDANLAKLEQRAKQSGFAPMDVFHKRHQQHSTRDHDVGGTGAVRSRSREGTTSRRRDRRPSKGVTAASTSRNSTGATDSDASSSSSTAPLASLKQSGRDKISAASGDASTIVIDDCNESGPSESVTESKVPQRSSRETAGDQTATLSSMNVNKGQSPMSKSRKQHTKTLLSKLKEKGMAAFDDYDSSSDDESVGLPSKIDAAQSTELVVRHSEDDKASAPARKLSICKAPVSKKAKHKLPLSKPKVNAKRTMNVVGMNPKFRTAGQKQVSSAKKSSNSSKPKSKTATSRGSTKQEPTQVPKPGEWLTTRRTTRDSLAIDSDVTSVASVYSSSRKCRSSATKKRTPVEFSRETDNEGASQDVESVLVWSTSRKSAEESDNNSSRSRKSNRKQSSTTGSTSTKKDDGSEAEVEFSKFSDKRQNMRQERSVANRRKDEFDSSSDDESGTDKPMPKKRPKLLSHAESPVVDLVNSSTQKEKTKRAPYGNRGKSRVELGSSSASRRRKRPGRNQDSTSLSFQSSSSDDSSTVAQKYMDPSSNSASSPLPGRRRTDKSRKRASSPSTLEEKVNMASFSPHSAGRGGISLPRDERSPVLDLTGDDSEDFGNTENPRPPVRARGAAKRSDYAISKQLVAPSFGLSLAKHNVPEPKRRRFGKQQEKTSSALTAIACKNATSSSPGFDSSDSEQDRQKRADDLGDWGSYRGDNAASSTNGSSHNGSTLAPLNSRVSKSTNSKSTGSSWKDSAHHAGDDLLVDTTSEDEDLMRGNSQTPNLPRKRLFNSSQWRSGSHSSFPASQRVPVTKRQKDRAH